MSSRTAGEEALAARIAPEILRFHILAESNAAHDQELKIGLKGLVLDYVHSQVPDSAGKEGLIEWLETTGPALKPCLRTGLPIRARPMGSPWKSQKTIFPTKAYGDMVFPCGHI